MSSINSHRDAQVSAYQYYHALPDKMHWAFVTSSARIRPIRAIGERIAHDIHSGILETPLRLFSRPWATNGIFAKFD